MTLTTTPELELARERLRAAIQQVEAAEGTDCYCHEGHIRNNTVCIICWHRRVLDNPDSSAAELNASALDCEHWVLEEG